jgi:SLT domain-containing protein
MVRPYAYGAGALGKGGSSSSNSNNPEGLSGASNTQGSGTRGGTSVKGFATGGLVSSATLALIGEGSSREAVLPLDDPSARELIGSSIAEAMAAHGGGGGGNIHVHVAGHVIGANDVAHLVSQISKRVKRGQANLTTSNSLRVTKRSA